MPIDTIRLDKYFFDKEEDTNIKVKLTSLIVDTAKQYEKVVSCRRHRNYRNARTCKESRD